jgi:threonine dehydrogenase-like Zn-dependent dehydrogenase
LRKPELIPPFRAASNVLGTGWLAAIAAAAGPGKIVTVVSDSAVGLLGVLAAKQLGTERIVAMSCYEPASSWPASSAPPTSSPNAATTASR